MHLWAVYRPFYLTLGWNEFGIHFPGVDWIYREDSIKFLKERGYPKRKRYMELAAWPGIKVTFTPLTTTIYAQTHYATGKELMAMKRTVVKLENYLQSLPSARLNLISLA